MEIGVTGCHGSPAVYRVEKGREPGREFVTTPPHFTVVPLAQVHLWLLTSVTRDPVQVRGQYRNIYHNDKKIDYMYIESFV